MERKELLLPLKCHNAIYYAPAEAPLTMLHLYHYQGEAHRTHLSARLNIPP